MATLAFWFVAAAMIYGGVDVVRKGLKISETRTITGPAARGIGIGMIVLGTCVVVAAYVYFGSGIE